MSANVSRRLRAIVAIPARDEEAHLPACLSALVEQKDRQKRLLGCVYGVLLLLNNCVDGSAQTAEVFKKRFGGRLRIVNQILAPSQANAGGARRLAIDMAVEWLEAEGAHDGLLLTTDADSRVGPTWIADNLTAIAAGADAVAGDIALDSVDAARLPSSLRRRGILEAKYGQQLIEISAYLDPQKHNPWPHHATASGASVALTLPAYRKIGGLPPLPLGEDKALIEALRQCDARIRFEPEIKVITSGRLVGRAQGGVADTMRKRSEQPSSFCDAFLEPLTAAMRRAHCRGRLRRAFARASVRQKGDRPFGHLWREVERTRLPASVALAPGDLPEQIGRAYEALRRLRARFGAPNNVEAEMLGTFVSDLLGDASDLR